MNGELAGATWAGRATMLLGPGTGRYSRNRPKYPKELER